MQEQYENKCLHKWKILSFTHPHGGPNPYDFINHETQGWGMRGCALFLFYLRSIALYFKAYEVMWQCFVWNTGQNSNIYSLNLAFEKCSLRTQLHIRTRRRRRNTVLASTTNERDLRISEVTFTIQTLRTPAKPLKMIEGRTFYWEHKRQR